MDYAVLVCTLRLESVKVLAPQSCVTVCDPVDCRPPGSSVHGILQARILEWVAISFSRGSSQPSDWTQVSCTAGRFFTIWATKEDLTHPNLMLGRTFLLLIETGQIHGQLIIESKGKKSPKYKMVKKRSHYYFLPLRSVSGFSSRYVWMWELDHKLSTKELMLLNCSAGEDSWESLGQQGDQTSQS